MNFPAEPRRFSSGGSRRRLSPSKTKAKRLGRVNKPRETLQLRLSYEFKRFPLRCRRFSWPGEVFPGLPPFSPGRGNAVQRRENPVHFRGNPVQGLGKTVHPRGEPGTPPGDFRDFILVWTSWPLPVIVSLSSPKEGGATAKLDNRVRVPAPSLRAAGAACQQNIMAKKSLKVSDLLGALAPLEKLSTNRGAPSPPKG